VALRETPATPVERDVLEESDRCLATFPIASRRRDQLGVGVADGETEADGDGDDVLPPAQTVAPNVPKSVATA
jgi:hypothetical protein